MGQTRTTHAIFAAARDVGLQVGLHAWGRAGKAATPSGFTTTYLEDYLGNQPIAQAQVLSFVSEGVFERFPELEVVVSECGFAWLAPLLWRFDKDWKGVWREVPWVKRRPSEYVREHFRFTTAPAHLPADPVALEQLLEMMDGHGLLVYAADYPHEHGDGLSALLDRLNDEQRRAMPPARRPSCTGSPFDWFDWYPPLGGPGRVCGRRPCTRFPGMSRASKNALVPGDRDR